MFKIQLAYSNWKFYYITRCFSFWTILPHFSIHWCDHIPPFYLYPVKLGRDRYFYTASDNKKTLIAHLQGIVFTKIPSPIRNAQSLDTSVHRKSVCHMTIIKPESRCTHLEFLRKKKKRGILNSVKDTNWPGTLHQKTVITGVSTN